MTHNISNLHKVIVIRSFIAIAKIIEHMHVMQNALTSFNFQVLSYIVAVCVFACVFVCLCVCVCVMSLVIGNLRIVKLQAIWMVMEKNLPHLC